MHPVSYFAASVRGPMHTALNEPNGDAWAVSQGRYGSVAVVADGVGSCSMGELGARAACKAAKKALLEWRPDFGPCDRALPCAITAAWLASLGEFDPSDCCATCLFALWLHDGTCVLGGLGDGLAAAHTAGQGLCIPLGDRGNGFANETVALGSHCTEEAWRITQLAPTRRRRAVMLATDGISDDLLPERVGEFMDWLVRRFGRMAPRARAQALRAELMAWPTPRHSDDKTVAVLWKDGTR